MDISGAAAGPSHWVFPSSAAVNITRSLGIIRMRVWLDQVGVGVGGVAVSGQQGTDHGAGSLLLSGPHQARSGPLAVPGQPCKDRNVSQGRAAWAEVAVAAG